MTSLGPGVGSGKSLISNSRFPVKTTPFLSMMIVMLIHAKLGCETVVQDYISSLYWQKTFKGLINFVTVITLLLVIAAIFKLSIIQ